MITILVLVVYDIQTKTDNGRRRLHHVAKKCEAVGKRVQNSVFECLLDASQFRDFRSTLLSIIDPQTDCLRFYNLGNHYESRIISDGDFTTDYYENPIIL